MTGRPGGSLSICLFTPLCPPSVGGAQNVLDQIARRLVEGGHRPVVVAPRPREAWDDRRLAYPVVRHRRPWSKRFAVHGILPRLAALHVRHRFDVVHCHSAYPHAVIAATMRRLFGVPYVVRPHGADILPGEEIRKSPLLDRRMRDAVTVADAVIAQGDSLRQVIADIGVAAERIHVVNNGVDLDAFRSAAAFPHPRPYLLGLGGLVPHKGFDILLRAYAMLREPTHDLLIAGDGTEAGPLARLAAELGVGGRVTFLGVVTGERKVGLYRSATLFVCPSRREPFANVILEAFAAGVPVVATDVGGNREMVEDGANGLVVPPESPEAMASAIDRLLGSAALVASLRDGAAGTGPRFDWAAVVDRYVAIYRQVIAARR
jgi:glycosyltransferase involved in cell wall biosynthesis